MSQPVPGRDHAVYAFGPFLLMPSQRALLNNGQPLRLGSRAFDILCALVEHAGQVVGKEMLFARAWPRSVVDDGGLRVHVAALRKALGETPAGPRYIINVPSRGYCFVAPVTDSGRPLDPAPRAGGSAPAMAATPANRLIGRAEAVLALVRALPQRRFATLVGPGGLGKTTVALAAAAELESHYADGVHFVDLSCVSDARQVPVCVATVLGVRHTPTDAMAPLLDWMSTRSMLLVLDNCEHLAEAAAPFAESWMRHGGSHLLTTSREPLRARNEWLVRLPPLASPPEDDSLTWDEAMRFPAFALFVERAIACAPGLSLVPAHIPRIARLCRRLDGIPLAIELVAAQIGFYGLHGLDGMLDGHQALTAIGYRTVQPRHQTLRGTLDWSWRLLPPLERRVLERLAIFRGRFQLPAAMAVAGERPSDASQALISLVNKSLVVTDPDDDSDSGVSYRLLETTRSYATELLMAGDSAGDAARAHAEQCLHLLQRAAVERGAIDADVWRRRQLSHLHDVRAALGWSLGADGDRELGARLVVNAAVYFSGIGALAEHMAWLEQAHATLPEALQQSELDMHLCLERGQAEMALRGACAQSRQALQHAGAIARRIGMVDCELAALRAECSGLLLQGDHAAAQQVALRYGEVADASLDARAMRSARRILGLCLHVQGRHAEALEAVRSAFYPDAVLPRHMFANISQPDERTAALVHLARICWVTGASNLARQAARDALDCARAVDHGLSQLYALAFAACPVAIWCHDLEDAARMVEQLAQCASQQALGFWQRWPDLYRHVMAQLSGADPDAGRLPDIAEPTHAAQADMLATFHPSLVGTLARRRALANDALWTSPEVLRALGERACADGERDTGLALIGKALGLARRQGAHAWALRSAMSQARLDPQPATHDQLSQALTPCLQGGPNGDTRQALAMLDAWRRADALRTAL